MPDLHGKEREALDRDLLSEEERKAMRAASLSPATESFAGTWLAARDFYRAPLAAREDTEHDALTMNRADREELAAREDTERPESEQERLAHLRCRCGTAIAVDCPEHGGGI